MKFRTRTHTCGELTQQNVGENVVLNGWVDRRRDLGGVIFIWIRDRYGITQVVFQEEINKEAYSLGKELRNEFVISVEGKVRKRPDDAVNEELKTGQIDVLVDRLIILNESETPPFAIKNDTDAFEDLRLSTGISTFEDLNSRTIYFFAIKCISLSENILMKIILLKSKHLY